ncbi:MAG: paraquat-inducible protein A [Spirochaetaceae bacterium]|nr:paraquat-inducible protein A [Myxococcales bacterium]MCB9725011.1 paraquat-inducible protein A [Spirochaetaceae bacterium]
MSALASAAGPGFPYAQCHTCRLVVAIPPVAAHDAHAALGCPRCGSDVHRRKPDSLSRTWAFLIAAILCYLPANLYPIMSVTSLGRTQADTILSGVVFLFSHGMWPLAFVVFVASVVVPVLKIVALVGLLASVQRRSRWDPRRRSLVYRVVEAIGRWSMVDVYVVTILAALVHMGKVAAVEAEAGAFFFGAVVVLTLFAAESFDPRLIWDVIEERDEQR